MKKIILAGLLMLSVVSFAAKGNNTGKQNREKPRTGIEQQLSHLTDEQKSELNQMRETHRRERQEMMLNIKEVNIKMKKEMLSDMPNRMEINRLIDERSKYRVAMEKKSVEQRFELKEKFGIDMRGHRSMMDEGHGKNNQMNKNKKNK